MTDLTTNEDLQWWVALFSLAIVGVLALYYSSANVKALEEKYELIFASHQTIEERHQTVLSLIQRRIELSTRGMVRHRQMF
jgi:acyl-[acyl carrier protein]--UDP-N-acetylglucosamine O-acyltransferase